MTKKNSIPNQKAQSPLVLRYHRLMDAFSKSDDERDFYLDKIEGFIIYVDLDRSEEDIISWEETLFTDAGRFRLVPKLTFYETKKIMEGFINEKVYDIDIKERLAEIIQSKEARENFLEFIYDQEIELEKWQLYYQERSRIRIIEWLRENEFHFVFEEDLELALSIVEKIKHNLFQTKTSKDVAQARQVLENKSKVYYSNEALNPRPKRGRPPKQVVKVEVEPQLTEDYYSTVPSAARPFLYTPGIASVSAVTFSAKFDNEEELRAKLRSSPKSETIMNLEAITKKLSSLSNLSKNVPGIEDELAVTDRSSQEIVFKSTKKEPLIKEPKEKKIDSLKMNMPSLPIESASEKEADVSKGRRLTKETPSEKKPNLLKRLIRKPSSKNAKKTPLKKARRIKIKDKEE